MEILNESLEELCEDLGGGEWEVEYSVCPLTTDHLLSIICYLNHITGLG